MESMLVVETTILVNIESMYFWGTTAISHEKLPWEGLGLEMQMEEASSFYSLSVIPIKPI